MSQDIEQLSAGSPATPSERELSRRIAVLAAALSERHNGLPVWVRAPKGGTEYFSGLTRALMYKLVAEGKIRSVSLRERPDQLKGVRLFNLASILNYIETQETAAMNAVDSFREVTRRK